mmetsp:Transcript_4563/g.7989  ORF Transcript_4563/g.7989 Transcript_4563/m.7989 type:complete len:115 (+) Transcript_4563:394-738(+)
MSGDEGRVPTIHEVEGLVTAQLHARFAEQVAQLASSKCFTACISSPGTALSSKESKCMEKYVVLRIVNRSLHPMKHSNLEFFSTFSLESSCVDRLVDAMNIVSATFARQSTSPF